MCRIFLLHQILIMGKFNKREFLNKWESQLRKGILEFIILLFLKDKEYYGYELINEIKKFTSMTISEGTIYPLLNRLKKEGLITSSWVEMETGVPRKYYTITEEGKNVLEEMKDVWLPVNFSLQKLMVKK